jgi:diguanylate cyclase (GGDEF)-like protein/PAS domain S-box-containing protein
MNINPAVTNTDDSPDRALLSALFQKNPLALCLSLADSGVLVDVNDAWTTLSGFRRDEVIGKTTVELGFWRDSAARQEALNALNAVGAAVSLETTMTVKDGSQLLVAFTVSRFDLDGQAQLLSQIQDVTARRREQAAVHESEMRFRRLTALSSDWYWEQDAQFCFTLIEGNAMIDHDLPPQSLIGKTRWGAGIYECPESQWKEHRRALDARETFHNLELMHVDGQGRVMWASVSGMPIFDATGQFTGYRGVGRNVSVAKRNEDENQRLAFYDTLTGLPNRRLLLDRLSQALITSARSHQQGALLFIDLDNFKDLNDTLGHDVGDVLLEKVANRLVTCIRQGDTVARFGGDEFVVMLEDLAADASSAVVQVSLVAEKIVAALNRPFELVDKLHYSTPSVGIALFSGQSHAVDELLKRADLAMYQAKAAGRNTFRFFDPQMQAAVALRSALEVDLRHGLEREELRLFYQPVVNEVGHVRGVEALVRWQHPERGMVSPADFIPVAEQSGLILPLGLWVLRVACEQLVSWAQDARTCGLTIAVNISARQFRQPEFVAQTLEVLAQTGAQPQLLKLELTESLLLADVQDAIRKMDALRAQGVHFALDDFGTGYSSLSYLKRLPLDLLKIDQSFVRDVLTDPSDAAIARTVVALAHSLGLSVVAEGVETAGQRDFLLGHGCQSFQGYLFGRPVPVQQLDLSHIASTVEVQI